LGRDGVGVAQDFPLNFVGGGADLAHRVAQGPGKGRHAFGPEKQQIDHEDQDDFHGSHAAKVGAAQGM
jgi:hypothetical protein